MSRDVCSHYVPLEFKCEKCEGDDSVTLRDRFAGQALQGLLANPKLQKEILKQGGAYSGWIELSAYAWADAMLDARRKDSR